eukprot:CAMPEP_0116897584 /NCGR_PEP_ID=MMETSP0467-20121206/6530_1 /TAXON_ID=283647 /ORGANISM="Mesodinium pulex, Strain SPMC105" /LENGTH=64 /DNA_ID=CAMNT_0004569305 /DNA_START=735 /DNA_END=929 /DNA_ORIENTATION=+
MSKKKKGLSKLAKQKQKLKQLTDCDHQSNKYKRKFPILMEFTLANVAKLNTSLVPVLRKNDVKT